MKNIPKASRNATQQGMALLEVLISVVLLSIGILGVVALQANMVHHTDNAQFRTEASLIAQKQAGALMMADAPGGLVEVTTDISGSGTGESSLPNARRSTTLQADGSYLITVTWLHQQTGVAHTYSIVAVP